MNDIVRAVEKNRQLILDTERYIWDNPETGYKEFKTTAYMEKVFTDLGYDITKADGITGFYTVIDTGKPGPQILVMGELDSIICAGHRDADKVSGAIHSCGHNAQCAALVGIAAALKESSILDGLCGSIRLCAVPAEELLEIDFREELRRQGKIKYLGGKSEFLSRGYFDGVDIAFMVHTDKFFRTKRGSNGFITKKIIYKGVASHAGCSPNNGINALYAANCGINAINAIRETFPDSDHIRVHPIITNGGSMVNAIPETVTIESYVRGSSIEAIERENKKINRALCGAALSLGANIEIIDMPGYSPLVNDAGMLEICREALEAALPNTPFVYDTTTMDGGSTDMGDLCCIMPVVHPYAGGCCGTAHGKDYEIHDPDAACVKSAIWQLAMLRLLLQNDACRAKKILSDFTPIFKTKEEFLRYQDSLNSSGDRITYGNDTATINLR